MARTLLHPMLQSLPWVTVPYGTCKRVAAASSAR